MNEMIKRMPEMLNGEGLLERLGEYPGYTPAIREKSSTRMERVSGAGDTRESSAVQIPLPS